MAFKSIIPIQEVQTYKHNKQTKGNTRQIKTNKTIVHIPYSKQSIEQDIKDHAKGGVRYCCLNANIIFQPECANHRWH